MKIPQIDLSSLPGLETATGLFGSTIDPSGAYNDKVVAIMVYIYDTVPPSTIA